MDRYRSEDLFRRFGFEKGLSLLNVMAARDLGMIPDRQVIHFVRKNIAFFTDAEEAKGKQIA